MSIAYQRYESLTDNQCWVQNISTENGLPLDMNDDGFQVQIPGDVEEFIHDIGAGLNLKMEVFLSSANTRTVFMRSIKPVVAFSFILHYIGDDLYNISMLAFTGDGSIQQVIMSRLLAALRRPVLTPGHYSLQVTEYSVKKDGGGNDRIDHATHILSTRNRLVGLRKELYPYLNVPKILMSFLLSKENLFLLYGDPGVGKTCLMKTFLRETAFLTSSNFRAIYVKDTRVLRMAEFWVALSSLSKNSGVVAGDDGSLRLQDHNTAYTYLILDDLDNELGTRSSERGADNFIVSQLLSFADGLFENQLKIIITTNQGISDIDRALVRPGRCFDVLHLRGLTREEALNVWVNNLGHTQEDFDKSFQGHDTVSQAALMSEHERIGALGDVSDYLIDPSISIRRLLI